MFGAHGHRRSYRQKRCARGSVVQYSNLRLERRWGVSPPLRPLRGRSRELWSRAELSAHVLELPALRAHRFCKQGENGATERGSVRVLARRSVRAAIRALGKHSRTGVDDAITVRS
jgi:hypothetical protein